MGTTITGIEPAYSLQSVKRLTEGHYMTIAAETVELALENLGYSQSQIEEIGEFIKERCCSKLARSICKRCFVFIGE